jgi:hypothetical protein
LALIARTIAFGFSAARSLRAVRRRGERPWCQHRTERLAGDSDRPRLLLADERLGGTVFAVRRGITTPLSGAGMSWPSPELRGARHRWHRAHPAAPLPESAAHATKASGVLWLLVPVRPRS